MQINVEAKLVNLCKPVREGLSATKRSHFAVLNACNAHLGKLKGEVKGEDKRSDGKYSAKKDTFKMSVTPARVQFSGNADIVGLFIAWHDAVQKAHNIAPMESTPIPTVFDAWLKFSEVKEETTA